MDTRGTYSGRPAPGPFHCLGCQVYVTGTASGHCPRCGFVPPVAVVVPEITAPRGGTYAVAALLAFLLFALARLV